MNEAQDSSIKAAKTIADLVRTCLGPRAMLKMLVDKVHGTTVTSDGNAILRELQVKHPSAQSIIELAQTQDRQVGDGTTSVIILAGELLMMLDPYLKLNIHPRILVTGLFDALNYCMALLEKISKPVDPKNLDQISAVIEAAIGTKMTHKIKGELCQLALKALMMIREDLGDGRVDYNIKRFIRIERIHGGSFADSCVLDGVALPKDVTHTGMKRKIVNPRIILLDSGLDYSKGESKTNVRVRTQGDFSKLLEIEEIYIKEMCADLIALKPDLVITEKGISDQAQQYLCDAGITALRRCRRSELDRVARCTGATIMNRTNELTEEHVGKDLGLFEVRKVGDDYWSFLVKSKNPRSCTIWLRGPSKDYLSEIWRNLEDALFVARILMVNPKIVPGGGAIHMTLSHFLTKKSNTIQGIKAYPYKALANALEVIPRTLISNCGTDTIRVLTQLRAEQTQFLESQPTPCFCTLGVNGITGKITDMKDPKGPNIWDATNVIAQTIKTAVEASCILMRIDEIVARKAPPPPPQME